MPRAGLDTAAVVEAAGELADAGGLEALTLSSVASRLGVKPPSLYSHVAGLPDLRARLAALAASELADALVPAVSGRAAGDALRGAGHAYRRWALAHPGRHAALQFVQLRNEPATKPATKPAAEPAAARLVELMVSVMHGYAIEGDAAIHAVRAIRAAIYGFVALEAGGGFAIPLASDESFEWLLTLLDRGLSAQPT
ncbi:MAG: TetR/AcrR family transcriptional regulator [Solirubrobacteraceae bacterium]